MALVTVAEAREAALTAVTQRAMTVEAMLRESSSMPMTTKFDFFLSHSSIDRTLVLGVKSILASKGYTVYIDWLDDPQLTRSTVSKQTADVIRRRMRQSVNLVYVHTANAALSRWCPWELGYFDAFSHPDERVFIFPLMDHKQEAFRGQEYLGLYRVLEVNNVLLRNAQQRDVVIGARSPS